MRSLLFLQPPFPLWLTTHWKIFRPIFRRMPKLSGRHRRMTCRKASGSIGESRKRFPERPFPTPLSWHRFRTKGFQNLQRTKLSFGATALKASRSRLVFRSCRTWARCRSRSATVSRIHRKRLLQIRRLFSKLGIVLPNWVLTDLNL